jgi:putative hydrolase of the HAD superfamily
MTTLRHVRALIFDLDDTLWPVAPVIRRAEERLLGWLAAHYPRIVERHDLRSMRELRARMALEHPRMRHDFTFLRLAALRAHAREAGYPESLAEEAFAVFYRARNEVQLYGDVLPTLARLHGRVRLLALSNGNADLVAIGLGGLFERALAAREAGVLKPDPRIFHQLLQRAGLAPGEVAHVGDDPDADVQGARGAGLEPVWVNREGAEWAHASPPPVLTIRTLQDLPPLLGL